MIMHESHEELDLNEEDEDYADIEHNFDNEEDEDKLMRRLEEIGDTALGLSNFTFSESVTVTLLFFSYYYCGSG